MGISEIIEILNLIIILIPESAFQGSKEAEHANVISQGLRLRLYIEEFPFPA